MEPVTLIAAAIATLIFSEALKRDGSVNQEVVVDAKFGDDLDLGNVNMKA